MIWRIFIILILIAVPVSGLAEFKESKIAAADRDDVLFSTNEAPEDGAILGSVISPKGEVTICAVNGSSEIKGTVNEDGEFFINGFEPGVYSVTISSKIDDEIKQLTYEDVEVRIGEVTALGTTDLD